jgi:UDP-N-acetylglucosamine 1-carboxyvinyltransferase
MDRFVVRPNGPLSGTIRVGGAKNSALKLMAACLLAEGRHVLRNVPRIIDVDIMTDILVALGAKVERSNDGDLIIDSPATASLVPEAPYELVERIRASVVVLGPLLARCGYARMSLPGGDDFGPRPIDMHLGGLEAMGTHFATTHGYVEGRVLDPSGRLIGTTITLEYPSHTATDNLMMAAALAKGTTVIENAAREPEICDLATFLTAMGATVRGAGTARLEIEGCERLSPAQHTVVTDRVVVATYLAAVGLAGGEITVEDARPEHIEMLLTKLVAIGLRVEMTAVGLRAASSGEIQSVDIATLPYPGVATDYKPLLVTMLTVGEGVAVVTENVTEGRFRYVDELRRMGADVRAEGHHAVVRGVGRLSGAPVRATDVRAGAALVLAGLVAEGETEVSGARHVDRGYEDLAGGLASLGAQVSRR